jgi:hypothetical protein
VLSFELRYFFFMGAKRPVPAGKGRQTPLPLNSSPLPALKARRIWELEYKDGKGQIFEGKPGSYSPHPLIAQSRRLEPSRRSFSLNFLTPFPLHRAFNALMDGPPFREVGNGDFFVLQLWFLADVPCPRLSIQSELDQLPVEAWFERPLKVFVADL